ncbi:MAG: hypothetical protein L6Q84_12050 [Polyangiaceae bacterium]|nr:hypothetical protein [Polyangiaceae bacterium]
MDQLLAFSLPAAFAAEWLVYLLGPRVLGRLAFIPIGDEERLELSAREQEVLGALPDAEIRADAYTTWLRPAAREIVSAGRWQLSRHRMGIATTHFRLEGPVVVARTRLFPFPSALWLLGLVAVVTNPAFVLLVAPLLFFAVLGPRHALLHARAVAFDELADMIAERADAAAGSSRETARES